MHFKINFFIHVFQRIHPTHISQNIFVLYNNIPSHPEIEFHTSMMFVDQLIIFRTIQGFCYLLEHPLRSANSHIVQGISNQHSATYIAHYLWWSVVLCTQHMVWVCLAVCHGIKVSQSDFTLLLGRAHTLIWVAMFAAHLVKHIPLCKCIIKSIHYLGNVLPWYRNNYIWLS